MVVLVVHALRLQAECLSSLARSDAMSATQAVFHRGPLVDTCSTDSALEGLAMDEDIRDGSNCTKNNSSVSWEDYIASPDLWVSCSQ